MKRFSSLLGILCTLLFAATVFAQQSQTQSSGKPAIEIAQPTFDAGDMYRSGAKIEHSFIIKNTGTAELKILNARPGCGCTVTDYDKVIAPGAEGKVYASVDVSHFSGNITKTIDVESNDTNKQHSQLTIKANVKTYVQIRPMEQVRFNVEKGKSQTQVLMLTPTFDKPIKLTGATVDSDNFTVTLDPPAPNTNDYKLTVGVKEAAKTGMQVAKVKVALEGAPVKEIEVPLTAVVRGPIAANPSLISFQIRSYPEEVSSNASSSIYQQPDPGTAAVTKVEPGDALKVIAQKDDWYQVITESKPDGAPAGSPAKVTRVGWINKSSIKVTKAAKLPDVQTVTIQKNAGNFKITDFSSTSTDVKLAVDPATGEANSFNLKVSLEHPGDIKKNMPPSMITVKTSDPDVPELKIPLYIIVS